MTSVEVSPRLAAHLAVYLTDFDAIGLGWPDPKQVAMHLANGVLDAVPGREITGPDPIGWVLDVATPAISRRLQESGEDFLRINRWPYVPDFAVAVIGWLVEDGILPG